MCVYKQGKKAAGSVPKPAGGLCQTLHSRLMLQWPPSPGPEGTSCLQEAILVSAALTTSINYNFFANGLYVAHNPHIFALQK